MTRGRRIIEGRARASVPSRDPIHPLLPQFEFNPQRCDEMFQYGTIALSTFPTTKKSRRRSWMVWCSGLLLMTVFLSGLWFSCLMSSPWDISPHDRLDATNRKKTTGSTEPDFDDPVCDQRRYFSIQELRQCLLQVVVPSNRSVILDELVEIMPSYVFLTEANVSSWTSFPDLMPVDLMAQLTDLRARLDDWEKKKTKNREEDIEFETTFHQDVFDLFTPLRDAHTVYLKPQIYRKYYAFQPQVAIRLEGFPHHHNNNNGVKSTLWFSTRSGDNETHGMNHSGPKQRPVIEKYDGWQILKINDAPAMNVLASFVKKDVGQVKDVASRWALALHGYSGSAGRASPGGFFTFRSLSHFNVPLENTMRYQLQHPTLRNVTEEVEVEWIGMNGDIPVGVDKTKKNSSTSSLLSKDPHHEKKQKNNVRDRRHNTSHFLKHYAEVLTRHGLLLIKGAPDLSDLQEANMPSFQKQVVQVTSHDDDEEKTITTKHVTIVKIPTFEGTSHWSRVIEHAVASITTEQAEVLVLDLRSNGGGDICLGYALLRHLFPQLYGPEGPREGQGPHEFAQYYLRTSDLFRALAIAGARLAAEAEMKNGDHSSEWNPNFWYSAKTQSRFRTNDWMNWSSSNRQQEQEPQRPQPSQRSLDVYFGCATSAFEYFDAPGTSFRGLAPSQVVLLSDGLCGSTCAVFSSFIQSFELGQTVVQSPFSFRRELGGVPHHQQFWSFPGGEVYRASEVAADARVLLGLATTLHHEAFDDNHGRDFSFAMLAIKPWNVHHAAPAVGDDDDDDDIPNHEPPLEYVAIPAQYQIPFHEPDDDRAIYHQAIQAVYGGR